PKPTAHGALAQALADYSGLMIASNKRMAAKKLKAERMRYRRIVAHAGRLKTDLYAIRRRSPGPSNDPEQPLRDLRAVTSILWRAKIQLAGLDGLARARQGHRDPDREFLLARLLKAWVDHFGGALTVSDRRRRPPTGPLVRFLLTATKGVLDP